MTSSLPSAEDVACGLRALSLKEVRALGARCGVSYMALWSIRRGNTVDPRLGTVNKVWPHISDIAAPAAPVKVVE